jgi:hypothetical protein
MLERAGDQTGGPKAAASEYLRDDSVRDSGRLEKSTIELASVWGGTKLVKSAKIPMRTHSLCVWSNGADTKKGTHELQRCGTPSA